MNAAQRQNAALAELLEDAPQFGFLEAVRFLSNLHPNAPAPGSKASYEKERVVFKHDAALSFGTSDISSIEQREGRFVVKSNFLGNSGTVSPLPQYMMEPLAYPGEDYELSRRYLDVFHHRLYALLYRGLSERDVPIQASEAAHSPWLNQMSCLLGIDSPYRSGIRHLNQQAILRLAPLLSTHTKPRSRIEQAINLLLAPYLKGPDNKIAKATIHDFEGEWNPIEQDTLLRLGQANHALSQTAILGKRVEHRACRARIEISPLHAAQQRYFEPGKVANNQLGELLALCLQTPIDFELDLRIRYHNQDHCTLGRSKLSIDAVLPGSQPAPLRRIQTKLSIPGLSNS